MRIELLIAIITTCGIIIGSVVGVLLQSFLERENNKQANKRSVYLLKIDTYADAIRYIILCCKEYNHRDYDDYEKILGEKEQIYNKFHPIFTIIAPKDVIYKYNDLRNMVGDGKIGYRDAYLKVVEILDFNISNEI